MALEQFDICVGKKQTLMFTYTTTNVNSRWTIDLNVKVKTTKLIEKK